MKIYLGEITKPFWKKLVGSVDLSGYSEAELIRSAQEGNKEAFEVLIEQVQPGIYNFLYHFLGKKELAEEVFQDVMLKLFTTLHYIDPEKGLKNYAYKMAKNRSIDIIKNKDALNFKLDLSFGDDENNLSVEDLVFHEDSPEIKAIQNNERERIEFCFEGLKGNQKLASSLRIFGELSYEDIANQLNTTSKAVKSLLNRAKQKLLECLKIELKGEES